MAPDKAPFAEITAHTNEVWEPNFQLPFQGGSLPQAQHHHHTLVWIWRAGGASCSADRGSLLRDCAGSALSRAVPLTRAGTAVCPRSAGSRRAPGRLRPERQGHVAPAQLGAQHSLVLAPMGGRGQQGPTRQDTAPAKGLQWCW